MPNYSGEVCFNALFTAFASNEEEAKSFIREAAEEEFQDVVIEDIKNIKEVKVN